MKRYILFAGRHYYANGGSEDYHSSHETLESVIHAVKVEMELEREYEFDTPEWFNVFDCLTEKAMTVDLDNMAIEYVE